MSGARTLRGRLILLLGVGVSTLWLLLASVLLLGVREEVQKTLDNRLAASARMVASLMQRQLAIGAPVDATARRGLAPEIIATPLFPASIACRVTDVGGRLLAQSQDAPEEVLVAAGTGYSTEERDGERWRVYASAHHGLQITTAERLSTRDDLMTAIVVAAAVPFGLAFAGTLVIVWFGIERNLKPLQRLGQHVRSREADALEPLIWPGAPPEVTPLLDEINRLLARVQRTLERERRFSGDAAHELRTPLTAIRTQLQVARLTQGAVADRALDQAEKAVGHLQNILEQLLLLARIEEETVVDVAAPAAAEAIVEAACSDLLPAGSRHQLALTFASGWDAPIAVPPALATAALRNLIENALRFTPPGTAVAVGVRDDGDHVLFSVLDQGPGVPEEQLGRVTHRFVRGGTLGGSGLGLAIVETIAARFGGSIVLRNATPGLEALLRLPKAQ